MKGFFSTMHISCTYLRASMKTQHLTLLAMMDLSINYSANDRWCFQRFFYAASKKDGNTWFALHSALNSILVTEYLVLTVFYSASDNPQWTHNQNWRSIKHSLQIVFLLSS